MSTAREELDGARAALRHLLAWDMLTLTAEGKGAATGDAPWARVFLNAVLNFLDDPMIATALARSEAIDAPIAADVDTRSPWGHGYLTARRELRAVGSTGEPT